jgi:hypothetical protein
MLSHVSVLTSLLSKDWTLGNVVVLGENCKVDEAILSTQNFWWPPLHTCVPPSIFMAEHHFIPYFNTCTMHLLLFCTVTNKCTIISQIITPLWYPSSAEAGSNPAEAIGFFSGKKIFSTPSFGGEVKPSVPCRRFTACKRSLNATWNSGISSKIHRPFHAHIVPPSATRISRETTSGESWNVWK